MGPRPGGLGLGAGTQLQRVSSVNASARPDSECGTVDSEHSRQPEPEADSENLNLKRPDTPPGHQIAQAAFDGAIARSGSGRLNSGLGRVLFWLLLVLESAPSR